MVLESIFKFFRLVLNGVYIDGNVRLLDWLKRRDCSYRKQKDVEGIMGQDMTKGTLWLC